VTTVAAEGGADMEAEAGDCGGPQDNSESTRQRDSKTADPQVSRGDSGEDKGGRDRGLRTGRLNIPGFHGETSTPRTTCPWGSRTWDIRWFAGQQFPGDSLLIINCTNADAGVYIGSINQMSY
jgi:hypothetical protein